MCGQKVPATQPTGILLGPGVQNLTKCVTPDEVEEVTPAEPEGGDAFTDAALARMKTIFGEDAIGDEIEGIDLADLIAASSDVVSVKDGDNAVTQIMEELAEQLDDLEDLMDDTNYDEGGTIEVPGADLEDGAGRRTIILEAVIAAAIRGGVTIVNANLVSAEVNTLNIKAENTPEASEDYDEEALMEWDEELLESLDKVVEAFSSEANLDEALDDGIFGEDADPVILSSFKAVGEDDPVLDDGGCLRCCSQ